MIDELIEKYTKLLQEAQEELAEAQEATGVSPTEYHIELGYTEGQRDAVYDILENLKKLKG